jgi:hypothetical protein
MIRCPGRFRAANSGFPWFASVRRGPLISTFTARFIINTTMLVLTTTQQQHHQLHDNDCSTTMNPAAEQQQQQQQDDNEQLAELGDYDVLCGRHKAAFNNTGNRRFRITVSLSLACFMKATSRKDKNTVIKSILKIVQGNGGRFLEYDGKMNQFIELTAKKAHMKVGHALRDMALASRKEIVVVVSESNSNNNYQHNHHHQANNTTAAAANSTTNRFQVVSASNATPTDPFAQQHDEEEQPVPMDPWDLLESSAVVPTAASTNELGFDASSSPDDADHDMDMLQWLVGESDGLLQHHQFADAAVATATAELPAGAATDFLQHHQQSSMAPVPPPPNPHPVQEYYYQERPQTIATTTTIEPIPLDSSVHNNGNNNIKEIDDDDNELRGSFVLDNSLLQWLVGESNDVLSERFFEMV